MKKLIVLPCLFVFFFLANQTFGQQTNIEVSVHSRVDTTQKEIKEIAELWINYLNAKPDSLYDNPYWNEAEKGKFKSYDHSAAYLYQFPANQLLSYYKPTILSIEKEGDNYGIRTIFSADGLSEEYRKSNPWCITKLYATKENNEWKLKNALSVITENWNKKTVGKITFIYPKHHTFDKALATKANLFCHKISKEFRFPEWKPFDFYVTDSADELGKLLNFDFFFAGYTTGIGMQENRILLSGLGSEYYPHEFIHLIVPQQDRHGLIEEGFATWKGGVGGKTFAENAERLANELTKNDTVTFSDILNKKWGWQYAAFYTTGAILCQAAYEKGGVNWVGKLLEIPNNHEKLLEMIGTLFEIEQKEMDSFWRKEVLKFRIK